MRADGWNCYDLPFMSAVNSIDWIADSVHPMLEAEREAYGQGFRRIAGVDEAGRGPLAGPIVAGAAILAEPIDGLNDSKQLSETRREQLFAELHAGAHALAIIVIDASEIDAHGIQQANYGSMARAVMALEPAADFALIDGFAVPGCALPQRKMIKGDARSMSIAAGSILAKVTRDRIMIDLDAKYPEYGFAKHKGYGTKAHLEMLAKYGPCPAHRRSFQPLAGRLETRDMFDGARE